MMLPGQLSHLPHHRLLLLCLLYVFPLISADFNIDDSILYKIDFPGFKENSQQDVGGLPEGPDPLKTTVVKMMSRNQEPYECILPNSDINSGKKETEYTGLSPLGLIEGMFLQQPCAYRLESYWTYELCHGRFLRQYHEEREGKELKSQEYSLGKFTLKHMQDLKTAEEKDKAEGIVRHPPTKKIDTLNMPYYEIDMEDGTHCELNNLPRRTKVLYICYPSGKNEIYSLKETSTCEYEVIVLTAQLCSHPYFRPAEAKEHPITCRPVNQQGGKKPMDLLELEAESVKLRSERMWEAFVTGGDKPGQVRIEIKPTGSVGSGEAVEMRGTDTGEEGDDPDLETLNRNMESVWRTVKREPFKPLMDAQVVKEFLRGEYCLYGGSGWWKYEFCYGKKVDQYHEEVGGRKTVINLGQFSKDKHIAWLQEHPTKRPKPVKSRKHVSHLYTDGDVCDLTGKPRSIEVKLKCKRAESPSTVTLYLLEPKTCEYVLGVESPLVCDILKHADDETGLVPEGILDALGTKQMDVIKELPGEEDFLTQAHKELYGEEAGHGDPGVETEYRESNVNVRPDDQPQEVVEEEEKEAEQEHLHSRGESDETKHQTEGEGTRDHQTEGPRDEL